MNTLEENSLLFTTVWFLLILVIFFFYNRHVKHSERFRNSQIDKVNRRYDDILIITFVFIFSAPVLVYFIIFLIRQYLVNNIITIGNAITWIGFAGSILGGSITMLAVLFTIRDNNKKREEDEKKFEKRLLSERQESIKKQTMEVMPIPDISFHIAEDGRSVESQGDRLEFTFRNASASSMFLHSINVEDFNYSFFENKKYIFQNKLSNHPIVLDAGERIVPGIYSYIFPVKIYNDEMRELLNRAVEGIGKISCRIVLSANYSDILDLQKYRMEFGLAFEIETVMRFEGFIPRYIIKNFSVASIPEKISTFPESKVDQLAAALNELNKD